MGESVLSYWWCLLKFLLLGWCWCLMILGSLVEVSSVESVVVSDKFVVVG